MAAAVNPLTLPR